MREKGYDLTRLRAAIKPLHLHFFPRLRSTNDHAAVLRKNKTLFAPAMVLTPHQIAGRGRGSNSWWSGDGSITATFVLAGGEAEAHQLPLAAGVAVRNAVSELTNSADVTLKWPNDLLFDGRKLAGLLCERVERVDLIGVGINVNIDPRRVPRHLRDRVASLYEILGRRIDLTTALATVSRHIYSAVARRGERLFAETLREYDRHHALLGRTVAVRFAREKVVAGRCEGLDSMGRLLVRDRSTLHRVIAGEVQSY
jgi:BirA family biotin operon repressor/biotin-[acetyl-CoA-carboxylase] ligase